jgi:membrane-bound serine protease (ClpP class)
LSKQKFPILANSSKSGAEGIIGEKGVAIEKLNPEGRVKVHGEIWNAMSDTPIKPREKVKVSEVLEGLMLKVEPLKK